MKITENPEYTRIELTHSSLGCGAIFRNSKNRPVKFPKKLEDKVDVVYREAKLHYANIEMAEELSYFEVKSKEGYRIISSDEYFSTNVHKTRLACHQEFAFLVEKYGGETFSCSTMKFINPFHPSIPEDYPRA